MHSSLAAFPSLKGSYQKFCCDACTYVNSSVVETLQPLSPPCSMYQNNAHTKNTCKPLTLQAVLSQQGSQKIFHDFHCVFSSGGCRAQLKCGWSYIAMTLDKEVWNSTRELNSDFLLKFSTVVSNKQGKPQLKSLYSAQRVN